MFSSLFYFIVADLWPNMVLSWRRRWLPTPVLLPGKFHGWRSLVGCSPWGCEESDMTERLHFDFSLSRIGEGNGNPLQCSCLENPRDGGAWWAAVYGVAQNWTRLKWLSSSSIVCLKIRKYESFTFVLCQTCFDSSSPRFSTKILEQTCQFLFLKILPRL